MRLSTNPTYAMFSVGRTWVRDVKNVKAEDRRMREGTRHLHERRETD